MSEYSLDEAEGMGRKAYASGHSIEDCPFSKDSEYRLYDAWSFGFREEEKYYQAVFEDEKL